MTRDAAAQAVHERLEHLTAAMPEPDIAAGWAALVAQLEPPVAPVVPFRGRPRPWRGIVLGVAAAMLIAGAAFAAVHHAAGDDGPASVGPSVTLPKHVSTGPHVHPPLSGPPPASHSDPQAPGAHHPDGSTSDGGSHGSAPSRSRSGDAPSGSTHHDTQPAHHDSPDDTDHGTGNDGTHDDNGQGNNSQGQDTQGNGSGNDQGSGGGQGSGDRGTHPGGSEHPSGGGGSEGDHGSANQGQGDGHGSNG